MPIFDPDNARIKMVALTINGQPNIRWHSLEKYNNSAKTDKAIIAGMMRRFKEYADKNSLEVNVIRFYDCENDELIIEYR